MSDMAKPTTLKIDEVEYVRADSIPKYTAPPVPVDDSTGNAYGPMLNRNVLVRTATYFIHGRLIGVYAQELVLQDASTVFNLGNLSSLATGKFTEAEAHPKGNCIVSRSAIIDVNPCA